MTDTAKSATRGDHDSPWKEALEGFFPDFLALLFPVIHAGIDWSRGYRFLDKEFQQIVRDAHGVPVASLAVLADADAHFRPEHYHADLWGCAIDFHFPMVKLIDWDTPKRWSTLEASDNCFALVVMAQIRAKATKDAASRKAWKFRLIRLMYDRGYDRKTILELFRVIDWMLQLPAALEVAFRQELFTFEETKQMPYVTTVERAGIEKGYRQGEVDLLLLLIENKFGADLAEDLRKRVALADSESLRRWSVRILTADTPDAIFH